MSYLFFFLSFVSAILLIIGLIKPSLLSKIFGKVPTKKIVSLLFAGLTVFSLVMTAITAPDMVETNNDSVKQDNSKSTIVESEITNNEAEDLAAPAETDIQNQDNNEQATNVVNSDYVAEAANNPAQVLYNVVRVVDGDTLSVSIDGKTETIRLIGINTPETVDPRKPVECFGIEASNKAKELLSGKKVRLEADSTQGERDKYGRLLRYVFLEDGTFFNKLMINEGYAYEYTYNTPYQYQAEFKQVETEAKNAKRGLWADNTCQQTSQTPSAVTNPQPTGHTFYTSSYYSAKYYYCDTDDGWKSLSSKYLKSFSTEQELLAQFPNKTLHESCK